MKLKTLVILILLSPVAAFTQTLNDSLAAKFLFNGNTGDSSGKNRHASIVGNGISLTTDRKGNPNSAYLFTGKGGSIRANVGKHTDEVTVTLWYYSETQTTPYPHFFDYGDYKLRCHIMWGNIYNNTDQFGILYESFNPNGNMMRGRIKPKDSTWVHIAVTFNKNTKKEKLYINGVLDKEMTVGNGALSLSDDILCIGRVRSGATSQTSLTYFNGKIDDVFVYSRELYKTEIVTLAEKDDDSGPMSIIETQNNSLLLYPNPANNILKFDLGESSSKNFSYTIYDIAGKVIIKEKVISSNAIDISILKKGTYFIEFISDDKLINTSSKFIKK